MELEPGLSARVALTVTDADTAQTLGSGDVPVLGTPRVELEHLLATPVGATVTAEARLSTVDGRRLAFAVTVHDGDRLAAQGTVERALVDRERFLAKVSP